MYHSHMTDVDALVLGIALIVVVALMLLGCISKGSL
jgi:hypothetical protein